MVPEAPDGSTRPVNSERPPPPSPSPRRWGAPESMAPRMHGRRTEPWGRGLPDGSCGGPSAAARLLRPSDAGGRAGPARALARSRAARRAAGRPDRRGRSVRRRRGSGLPRLAGPNRPDQRHVRAAGSRVRLPHLRHAPLLQRGDGRRRHGRRPSWCAPWSPARASTGRTDGPGPPRVARSGSTGRHNGLDLTDERRGPLWIERRPGPPVGEIATLAADRRRVRRRVGRRPWRFYLPTSRHLSVRPRRDPRTVAAGRPSTRPRVPLQTTIQHCLRRVSCHAIAARIRNREIVASGPLY